jgi:hypothetical protein
MGVELVHHLAPLDDVVRVSVNTKTAQRAGKLIDPTGSSLEHPAMVPLRDVTS